MSKALQRTCMGCNQKQNKKELLRIATDKDENVKVDREGKSQGRGAYICNNSKCLEKVIKTKRLERVLDVKISDEIYEELRGVSNDR